MKEARGLVSGLVSLKEVPGVPNSGLDSGSGSRGSGSGACRREEPNQKWLRSPMERAFGHENQSGFDHHLGHLVLTSPSTGCVPGGGLSVPRNATAVELGCETGPNAVFFQ